MLAACPLELGTRNATVCLSYSFTKIAASSYSKVIRGEVSGDCCCGDNCDAKRTRLAYTALFDASSPLPSFNRQSPEESLQIIPPTPSLSPDTRDCIRGREDCACDSPLLFAAMVGTTGTIAGEATMRCAARSALVVCRCRINPGLYALK